MQIGNFIVTASECGNYLYAQHPETGYTQIKLDDEGVVVDIFDGTDESQASTYATYRELEPE